jgi:hypothetical protein
VCAGDRLALDLGHPVQPSVRAALVSLSVFVHSLAGFGSKM